GGGRGVAHTCLSPPPRRVPPLGSPSATRALGRLLANALPGTAAGCPVVGGRVRGLCRNLVDPVLRESREFLVGGPLLVQNLLEQRDGIGVSHRARPSDHRR